jgi:hypothetical protein
MCKSGTTPTRDNIPVVFYFKETEGSVLLYFVFKTFYFIGSHKNKSPESFIILAVNVCKLKQ